MLKNYLTIAFRNLRRHKIFSMINMAGLAIGISAALVIYLIVQYEFDFDTFHKDKDRIYRVVSEMKFPDLTINNSGVPEPTAEAFRKEIPGLEVVAHYITANEIKVQVPLAGSSSPAVFKKQEHVIYADGNYFSLFDYTWLAGSPQVALKDPFQVVLSESRARSYFGQMPLNEMVGHTLIYDDSIKATVSGIVKDLQEPTDFVSKEFVSLATIHNTGLKEHWGVDDWGSINSASQMLVKLAPQTAQAPLLKQFALVREKYRKKNEQGEADMVTHNLQPLGDIHFNKIYDAMGRRQAHKPTLYGLLAVAAFLLLLGCINFINLTTAQASQRAREIGIRKTMGSSKRQLVFQFLSETFLLTLLATLLSILITPWLLKIFSDFIPPGVSFSSVNQPHVWIFLLALVVSVTLLAGIYPAWVLTRFNPVLVLKNQAYNGTNQTRNVWMRKALTITQFVIAQFLVIATLVVGKQIHYSLNKEMGYNKEAIAYLNTPWDFYSKEPDNRRFVLMEKLKAIPEIEKLSLAGSAPASNNTSSSTLKIDNGKKLVETMAEIKKGDSSYFDLYGMKLAAGRYLQSSDTTKEYLINEAFAKFLGFEKPEMAIGRFVERNDAQLPIVGVIKDFHTKSTHAEIKPLAFSAERRSSYVVHIKLRPQQGGDALWKRGMDKVEKAFKEIYPEEDFSYKFFDESIAAFYKAEQNISRLLKWASGLCIFISCLGLMGLAMFITNTRTKEIGVRKVLGASVIQIIALLSKGFIALVLVAFLIALPISWWAMNNWLGDFQYRTSLSWWLFAATGIGMVLIALLILSLRTIRSATANPVRSLRSE